MLPSILLAFAGVVWGHAGCLQPGAFECQVDTQCQVGGMQGFCQVETSTCFYQTGSCSTNYANGRGECVEAPSTLPGEESGGESEQTTGSPLPGSTGDEPDSVDETVGEMTDGTTSAGEEEATTEDQSTGPVLPCGGSTTNLTPIGVVGASSVFNNDYPASLSVDDDQSTSWFSDGPEGPGIPSVFSWSTSQAHCISSLLFRGNGLHTNPDFREDYGFARVVVKIYDSANTPVFQVDFDLPGTPDPELDIETGGVTGKRVELELYGHESSNCGGFSELKVLGN